MSATVRTEKIYSCLINFKNNCNSNEHKKLIDIFLPMLHQENKHRLEISVGKKVSDYSFQSILSMITTDFIIRLTCWNYEPQLIIKDNTKFKNIITTINLALIKNIKIESKEESKINFFEYNIYFNYNNEIDYCIHIIK